jgi:hypothetical protein
MCVEWSLLPTIQNCEIARVMMDQEVAGGDHAGRAVGESVHEGGQSL